MEVPTDIKYPGLTFGPDFKSGIRTDGTTVKFSRAERHVLQAFHQSGGAILTRDRLLDAVAGEGSATRDRNIDFLIHRLRRKLGDTAGAPEFIETRYGEGYAWVARPTPASSPAQGAFIVIGPVHGKPRATRLRAAADDFARNLANALSLTTAPENRVAIDEECPHPDQFEGPPPRFAVEMSFLDFDGRLDCALVVRHYASSQIIELTRTCVVGRGSDDGAGREAAARTAGALHTAIWEELVYRGRHVEEPSVAPLPVRMYNAARLLAFKSPWSETCDQLRARLDADPDNAETQIMLATALHSKYVMSGGIGPENDNRTADEAEMEKLLLACLPRVQDNPVFLLSAAKLLYFLDRGFRPMAIRIMEEGAESSTAFATTCAILGQLRMFRGDTDGATDLLEKGLQLCRDDVEFESYLLVMATHARLAAGDREGLKTVAERLYAARPATRAGLSMFNTVDGRTDVDPSAHVVVDALTPARASGILVWGNYVTARLFEREVHAVNMFRGLATLLVDRFGPEIIPDEFGATVPTLVAELTGRAS